MKRSMPSILPQGDSRFYSLEAVHSSDSRPEEGIQFISAPKATHW